MLVPVSSVDIGSLAEKYGLQVGDQILLVNEHSFRNILHAEAVSVLRNDKVLMMTVKVNQLHVYVQLNYYACLHFLQSVGKIPKLAKSRSKNKGQQFKPVSEEAPAASPGTGDPTMSCEH